jgi:hypothetical protein
MALLTQGQLAAVRRAAVLGMTTPIVIERRSEGAIPSGGDYGDDFLEFTETTESRRTSVLGWFYSTPTPMQDVDTGVVVTSNTYRLYLPVGTDIDVGDHVFVGSNPDAYTVSDTTRESTWGALLEVSMRRRE